MGQPSVRPEVTAETWPALEAQGFKFLTHAWFGVGEYTPGESAEDHLFTLQAKYGEANVLVGWPWDEALGRPTQASPVNGATGVYIRSGEAGSSDTRANR